MKKILFYASSLIIFVVYNISSIYGQNKTFNITFNESDFTINESNENRKNIIIKNLRFYYKESPGKPNLPSYTAKIVVPENASFIKLNYSLNKTLIAENIFIEPSQYPVPFTKNITKAPKVEPDQVIYNSDKAFPEKNVEYTSIQYLSKYTFFTFDVCPFIYYPKEQKLYFVESITISVDYNLEAEKLLSKNWDDGLFYDLLYYQVENPTDLVTPKKSSLKSKSITSQYLIITSSSLESDFQVLVNWKLQKGITADVITTDFIYSNYAGSSNQLKIKNCIYDYYQNKGTIWVLLGGDNTLVPDQDCYANVGGYYEDYYMPTDLFYACFDNQFNWDADSDGILGELTDNIDMAPEIIISRAPVQNTTHTSAFVNKSINYEQNPPFSNFAEEMVICGVEAWNTWGGRSDMDWRGEKMWNDFINPNWSGTHYRFYDTNTDFGGSSYDVTVTNMSTVLNNGYNYFFMGTHGDQQLWSTEDSYYFNSTDASNLSNINSQGIVVTIACITNAFDESSGFTADPCLSEAFIRNSNGGAVGYFGSSRYGWGNGDMTEELGSSYLYASSFFEYLFSGVPASKPYKLGAATAQSKINYIGASYDDNPERWLQFSLNTIGDPELDLYTANPQIITANSIDTILCGATSLYIYGVSCSDGIASLYTNGQLLGVTQLSGDTGTISFNPIPNTYSSITLTITKHNYKPYIIQIPVDTTNCSLAPYADFIASETQACINSPVVFTDLSYFSPTLWNWSFSPSTITYLNSTSSTSQNPEVQFNATGNYTVTLIVTNVEGSDTLSESNYITISNIDADFLVDQQNITIGSTVEFTDNTNCQPTSYLWDFGNGANPATANTGGPHSVTYTSSGLKTISLTVDGVDTETKIDYLDVSEEFIMCSQTSSNSQSGTLFDSGGLSGNYSNYENCEFLINPGCAIDITLSFTSFYSPTSYDYMSVYDGMDATGTLIGNFTYISSPPADITAYSGSMYIEWVSNSSSNYTGWEASWSSTVSSSAPIADFSISNITPPLNTLVQFNDLTTNNPGSWNWDFGDGNTSTQQNPSHAYVNSGSYTITLISNNCFASDTVSYNVFVQDPPIINVTPNPVIVTVACGDSTNIPLNIFNTGSGDLVYEIDGSGSSSNSTIELLALTYGVDYSEEYTNTINAINQYFTDYNLTEINTTVAATLETQLVGKDVLLIAEQENGNPTVFTGFATVIQDFVNNGGTVIFCGTSNYSCITNTGLFAGTGGSGANGYSMNVIDNTHPITDGFPSTITGQNATYTLSISNPNAVTIVEYSGFDVVSYREINNGKAIFIAYDYYAYDNYASQIISNAVEWSGLGSLENWLTPSQYTDTVIPSDTSLITLTLDASNLYVGTYYDTLIINSNDTSNTPLSVPVIFTVTGQPLMNLSQNSFDFGTLQVGASFTDTLFIDNDGCDTLDITSFISTNISFTVNSGVFQIPPYSTDTVLITFSPDTIKTYADTIYINNNDTNTYILVNGIGVGAPIISYNPTSIVDTIYGCNDSLVVPVTIYNTGQGPLYCAIDLEEVSSGGGGTVFYDGFESGSIASWTDEGGSYTKQITSTDPASGSYCYEMMNGNSAHMDGISHAFTNSTPSEISFKLKSTSSGEYGSFIVIGDNPASTSDAMLYLFMDNGGSFFVNDNSSMSSYTANLWSNIELKNIDWTLKTFDFYVNSVLEMQAMSFNNTGVNQINIVHLYTWSGICSSYFDDVQIGEAVAPQWISVNTDTLNINIADSAIFNATLYSDGLNSGTYNTDIIISSNDPVSLLDTIPVTMVVEGVPSISSNVNCLHYGIVMQNATVVDSVWIYNTGCDSLIISSIIPTTTDYLPSVSSLIIAPADSFLLHVSMSDSIMGANDDTLWLYSNAGTFSICLTATITGSPIISYNPTSIIDTIYSCNDSITIPVTVYNTGQGPLYTSINLEEISSGGGTAFYDGFESGNLSNWTFESGSYTKQISSSNPATGTYCFEMINGTTNHMDGISNTFSNSTPSEISFKLKSTSITQYGSFIIIGDNPGSYSDGLLYLYMTNYGNFYVNGNSGVSSYIANQWVYVELKNIDWTLKIFDLYVDGVLESPSLSFNNTSTNQINTVHLYTWDGVCSSYFDDLQIGEAITPQWISINPDTLNINIADSSIFYVTLYSTGLVSGIYNTDIILSSNDPLNSFDTIPVTMVVEGVPSISSNVNCLHYGSVMQNAIVVDSVWIYNTGCDSLLISSIVPTTTDYLASVGSITIAPVDSFLLHVSMSDSTIGINADTLWIYSNAGSFPICLTANITAAPIISTDPISFNVNLGACADSITLPLTIYNTGGGLLNYSFMNILGGGYDSTITQYYTITGHNLDYLFNGLNSSDSVHVEVTINGDYDSSSEYADLYIDGGFIQQIVDGDPSNGTDIVTTYHFGGPSVLTWLSDGIITVTIDNSSSVNTGYGTQLNQVRLWMGGIGWINASVGSGIVSSGDSSIVNITFNSDGMSGGVYYSDIIISSNDPLNPQVTVPCTLNVSFDPCAEFIYDIPNACSGQVDFTDNSLNNPTSWQWDFGDGNTSFLQNPTNMYTNPGNYNVQLIVCNGVSCDTTNYIVTLTNTSGPVNASCTPTSYYTYTNYDIENVTFNTINNSSGGTVNGYEDFTCTSNTTLTEGLTYPISITTGYSSYQKNIQIYIDFNNNGILEPLELVWDTINSYSIHQGNITIPINAVMGTSLRMRVIEDRNSYNISDACYNPYYGEVEDYTVIIQSNTLPPVALFMHNILDECQGMIQLIDNSTNIPTSWYWDFGDGITSSYQNPYHNYSNAGIYTVTLVATNSFGFDTYSYQITINSLNPNILYSGNLAINQPITFNTSAIGILSWHWDFNDGNTSTLPSPTHTYTVSDYYTVTLDVQNAVGCTAQAFLNIFIENQVGIEKNEKNVIKIYPNPTKEILYIENNDHDDLKFEILSVSGQVIKREVLENTLNTIDVSNIASGVYLIKIFNDNVNCNKKLTIQ